MDISKVIFVLSINSNVCIMQEKNNKMNILCFMKKPQNCDNPLKAFESASVSTARIVLDDLTSDLMLTKPPKSLAEIYISGVNPVNLFYTKS